MSGDDRERDWADSLFVAERLFALDEATKRDAKATEDAFHRIILDLLRSRTPSRRTLDLTAGELERLWFPKEYKKQQRRSRAAGKLMAMDHLIDTSSVGRASASRELRRRRKPQRLSA